MFVYSLSFNGDYEAGDFTATRYPANCAVGGGYVIMASSDNAAETHFHVAADELWNMPDERLPHDFNVMVVDSHALTDGFANGTICKCCGGMEPVTAHGARYCSECWHTM